MIRSFLKYVSLNATICHSCSVASISAAVSWTESISGSLRVFCQSILKSHYKMHFRFSSAFLNEKPLQDAAHALLLQKPVQESVFVAWILPVTGDGIQHVFTLLVVEMVRGSFRHNRKTASDNMLPAWFMHVVARLGTGCSTLAKCFATSTLLLLRENVAGLRLSRRQQWDAWYTWPTKSRLRLAHILLRIWRRLAPCHSW